MSLGAPLGLLALGALAPLALVYWLRRRQPPRLVSAAFLWRSPSHRAEAGPRLERFSRELSFLFEALAVVAAALFLADAQCGAASASSHLVVVVDGSLSLRARGPDGVEAAQRLRDGVRALADERRAAWLTIVESGLVPQVLAGPRKDASGALAALDRWSPGRPRHALGPAVTLAREVAGELDAPVFVFTDGPGGDVASLPSGTSVRSVGVRLDNVAFVSAQRLDGDTGAVLTLGVVSFSRASRTVELQVCDDTGRLLESVRLALEPGVPAVARIASTAAGPLRASLPDDALPEDGVVTLWPARERPVESRIQGGLDPGAERAIRAALAAFSGQRPVDVGTPRADGGDGASAGTATAGEAQLHAPVLVIGDRGSGARVQVGARGSLTSYLGPFFTRREHPVLDDVNFEGVVWTAGDAPPGRPLVRAGKATLVSEESDGTLHLNVALRRSNVQRSEAWPVLWANVARLVRGEAPGFSARNPTLGARVAVTVPRRDETGDPPRWSLREASGHARPLLGTGPLPLPPLEHAGRLELLRNDRSVDFVEISSVDAVESDLRSRGDLSSELAGAGAAAPRAVAEPSSSDRGASRSWWLVWAMLALLLADAWWLGRPARGHT